jgi:hypothetical protein
VVFVLSLFVNCAPIAATTTQPAATLKGTVAEATAANTASSAAEATTIDTTKDAAYAKALTFNNSAWSYDADNDVY